MFRKNPRRGYQAKKVKPKLKINIKKHKKGYVHSLIVAPTKKIGMVERVLKFIIYIALRLIIKPSKWRDPEKNYEIIDRTYKRVVSADMIFIPSSIAFYLIMAFMPILSLIAFLYSITDLQDILGGGIKIDPVTGESVFNGASLESVLGKFIPGISGLLKSLSDLNGNGINATGVVGTLTALIVSTWISAGGFSKLVYTQSYVYQHKFTGGYWANKIKGMSMVIVFTLFLVLALGVNVLVDHLIETNISSYMLRQVTSYIFLIIGLFVGLFCGFIILFKFSPRFKISIKHVIPGAMVATVPIAIFLTLFGIISSYWHYGSYGAIGSIMYIGMASLIITYFVYVGIAANAAYYKTFVAKTMKSKWTLSRK